MESGRSAVAAYLVWGFVSLAGSAGAALILASSALAGARGGLWFLVPLAVAIVGVAAAFAFMAAAWGRSHKPSAGTPMPLIMGLAQGAIVYQLTSRFLDGGSEAQDSLNKGGLVLIMLLLAVAVSAIAGSIAVLFLRDRAPA